jgi:hypothetical protein
MTFQSLQSNTMDFHGTFAEKLLTSLAEQILATSLNFDLQPRKQSVLSNSHPSRCHEYFPSILTTGKLEESEKRGIDLGDSGNAAGHSQLRVDFWTFHHQRESVQSDPLDFMNARQNKRPTTGDKLRSTVISHT